MADVAVPSGSRSGPPAQKPAGAGSRSLVTFYHDVMAEMRKVTWPDHAQVRQATIAIIIFVLLFGLVIWLLDVALGAILVKLIPSLFAR